MEGYLLESLRCNNNRRITVNNEIKAIFIRVLIGLCKSVRISWAIWREEYIYRARIFAPYGCNRKILRCLAQSGLIASLQVRYLIHCCCALQKRSLNYLNNNKNLSTTLSGTLLRREGEKIVFLSSEWLKTRYVNRLDSLRL